MSLLLDTNALLWWLGQRSMSREAKDRISRREEAVFVSATSIWEAEIKRTKHGLRAPESLIDAVEAEGFAALTIRLDHGERAGRLPRHHEDPFDRMLIAQAQIERLTIVTRDSVFDLYEVDVLPC